MKEITELVNQKMSIFKRKVEEENWLSVSDLMAGLMIVFLLLLIIYSTRTADIYQKANSNLFMSGRKKKLKFMIR